MPGAGGTQRLTRAVGKAVAMDVILTGRFLSAREALAAGLVARVVAREAWLDEAKRLARAIAEKARSRPVAKEAVDRAFEAPLQLGVEYERRSLRSRWTEDAHEGMSAFLEKRQPEQGREMNVDERQRGTGLAIVGPEGVREPRDARAPPVGARPMN